MNQNPQNSWKVTRLLAFMFFFTFAMTTDAIGVIIPEIIKEFQIGLTVASAFHYSTMIALAMSAIFLGHLVDNIGHKKAIIIGLAVYGISCALFVIGQSYWMFLSLLFLGGFGIGIIRTSALSLIGETTTGNHEHTRSMNIAEGFYAVGAITGPLVATYLIGAQIAWQYLYLFAASICMALLWASVIVRYPKTENSADTRVGFMQTLAKVKDPQALFFGISIALYVSTEVAIIVWLPTLLLDYRGSALWLSVYALPIFLMFRAVGRFIGWPILSYFSWTTVMGWLTLLIFLCYILTLLFGVSAGVFLLPITGLFMALIYPTLNSKCISCFPKSEHGSIAGLIVFFTALSAGGTPLLMGLVGDWFGHVRHGFTLITVFAGLLFAAMIYNHICQPAARRLEE